VAVKSVKTAHTLDALHLANEEMDMMALAAQWGPHCLGAIAAFWSPLLHADGVTRFGTTFHVVMPCASCHYRGLVILQSVEVMLLSRASCLVDL